MTCLCKKELQQMTHNFMHYVCHQVYNDLGSEDMYRPTLGDSEKLPFPRRLATNRPTDSKGQETRADGHIWLPLGKTDSQIQT